MDVESGNGSGHTKGGKLFNGLSLSSPNNYSLIGNETAKTVPKYANGYHVYFLSIAMTFGGFHADWSFGLHDGFIIYILGFIAVSIGHIALVLCSAEMTGILPFSGGSYGFARVTINPYVGFLVGYCDAYRCLTYVMRRVFTFGRMMTLATGAPNGLQPLFWLLVFIPCIAVDSLGSAKFWNLMLLFGVLTFLTTLLYLFVAAPQANFKHYVSDVPHSLDVDGGIGGFVFAAVSASRIYLGLVTLPLCCEETKEPRVTVPWAMLASTITLILFQLFITFTAVSSPPGIEYLKQTEYPLLQGFARAFDITTGQGILFSLVALYSACFGYAYSYGRLMCALSRSGLLPSIGSIVYGERQSPLIAMIVGNLIVFCIMVALFYNDLDERAIFSSGSLASLVVFVSTFVSFIVFRRRFTTLQKTLVNPFGIPSAVVGLLIFCIPAIYILGYMPKRVAAIVIFIVFITVSSIFYFLRIARTQSYSEEEQSILLVLYVMTANRSRKKRSQRKAKKASYAVVNKKSSQKDLTAQDPHNNANNNQPQLPASRQALSEDNNDMNSCLPTLWSRYFPFMRTSANSSFSTSTSATTTIHQPSNVSRKYSDNNGSSKHNAEDDGGNDNIDNSNHHSNNGHEMSVRQPFRNLLQPKQNLQIVHPSTNTNQTAALGAARAEGVSTVSASSPSVAMSNRTAAVSATAMTLGTNSDDTAVFDSSFHAGTSVGIQKDVVCKLSETENDKDNQVQMSPSDYLVASNPSFVHVKPKSHNLFVVNTSTDNKHPHVSVKEQEYEEEGHSGLKAFLALDNAAIMSVGDEDGGKNAVNKFGPSVITEEISATTAESGLSRYQCDKQENQEMHDLNQNIKRSETPPTVCITASTNGNASKSNSNADNTSEPS